jgi:hypothetical protein
MYQYRAVLVRLRQGDSDRGIARARLMGRPKVAALRASGRSRSSAPECRKERKTVQTIPLSSCEA